MKPTIVYGIFSLFILPVCSSPVNSTLEDAAMPSNPVLASTTSLKAVEVTQRLRQYREIRDTIAHAEPIEPIANGYQATSTSTHMQQGWRTLGSTLHATLPSTFGEPLRLSENTEPEAWVEIYAENITHSSSERTDTALVYRNVARDTDAIHVVQQDHVEELRMVYSAKAPNTIHYRIKTSPGISSVHLHDQRIEILNQQGSVKFASEPMFLIDAKGHRRDINLSLVSSSGTQRNEPEKEYIATATWSTEGLEFPIVVDPKWWILKPGLGRRYSGAASVLVGEHEIWVLGGDDLYKKSVSVFNLVSNTWSHSPSSNLPELPHDHVYPQAVVLPNQQIAVIGGTNSKDIDIFDLTSRKWVATYLMQAAREQPATVWLPKQNRLLIAGSGGSEFFTLGVGTQPASDVPQDIRNPKAALLRDGRVIVVNRDYTFFFDPTKPIKQAWSEGPRLNNSDRHFPAMVTLLDGSPFIIGALGNKTAERFNGTQWELIPFNIGCLRYSANAVLLTNGLVLVTGDSCINIPMVYDPYANTWTIIQYTKGSQIGRGWDALFALPRNRAFAIAQDGTTELFEPNIGSLCKVNEDCPLGFCVDGVCCDRTCSGQCESCKEVGSVGTCIAVDGTPRAPRVACQAATGTDTCEQWSCHKDQNPKACTQPKQGDVCKAAYCESGLLIEPYQCNDKKECKPTRSTSCLPFICEQGACKTQCITNRDCAIGTCNLSTGICEPETPRTNASKVKKCTSSHDCQNDYCVDGVCCDSPCKDQCHSCALPWAVGKCSRVPAGLDLRGECIDGGLCRSTCGEKGECVPASAGALCNPSQCVTHSTGLGAGYCNAQAGSCVYSLTGPFDCKEYACEPVLGACYTQCESNEQCAQGYVCDRTHKACKEIPTSSKAGCNFQRFEPSSQTQMLGIYSTFVIVIMILRMRRKRASRQSI